MSEHEHAAEVSLSEDEREALRTSGSWPHVGRDLFAAVETLIAARLAPVQAERDRLAEGIARVEALADEWEAAGVRDHGGDAGMSYSVAAFALRTRLRALLAEVSDD